MKHRMQLFLLPILSSVLLSACSNTILTEEKELFRFETQESTYSVEVKKVDDLNAEIVLETGYSDTDLLLSENEKFTEEESSVLVADEDAEILVEDLGGDFAYCQMEEADRPVYDAIFDILRKGQKGVKVPTVDPGQIDRAFNCVMLDHPELFYVNGYTYTKYSVKGEIQSIDFSGSYTMEEVDIRQNQEQLVKRCNEILKEMPQESDYLKVKYMYEYIILNTEYEQGSKDNQNVLSVFLHGKSVCQGYAKAMQYLALAAGLDSILVTGTVNDGEGHAWDIIELEDDYYHVDVTWGDASYNSNEKAENVSVPDINYDYLCVSTEEIKRSHKIESELKLPICDHLENNYYVREGAYFTTMDEEQIRVLFENGYANGEHFITLKCSDETVYEQMYQYLLKDIHIFEYVQGNPDQIVYTLNEQQNSMSFWL